jgi:hypothetical protein
MENKSDSNIMAVFGNIKGSYNAKKHQLTTFLTKGDTLSHYKTIVILPGIVSEIKNTSERDQERILRRKDIMNALAQGSHVCILCDNKEDALVKDLFEELSIQMFKSSQPVTQYNIRRSEFDGFLKEYGTIFSIFSVDVEDTTVICTVADIDIILPEKLDENISRRLTQPRNTFSPSRNEILRKIRQDLLSTVPKYKEEFIAGFSKKIGKGLLTILPFFVSNSGYLEFPKDDNVIWYLRSALDSHRKNIIIEPPNWIDNIKLENEIKLEKEISNLRNQIDCKQPLLDKQIKSKSILWLKDNELRDTCIEVLNEIGLATLKQDIGEEDFWIIDDSNVKIAMVECKGKDGDLVRQDISKFDEHREAREKTEKFPALLIANTHNKAGDLSEKDQPIPSNVIEKAVRMKILLTRTIDLIRLLNLIQKGILSTKNFLDHLKTSHGWLEINEEEKLKVIIK